ncbi:S1 RNA-binding domain-containing protein [Pirellulales bacterium]|nr:S1 RNA-binding domain-containing protein [Pirellulales bacterium]
MSVESEVKSSDAVDASPSAPVESQSAADAASPGSSSPESSSPESSSPESSSPGSSSPESPAEAASRVEPPAEIPESPAPAGETSPAARPSERIQIGSLRKSDEAAEAKPRPVLPVHESSSEPEPPRKNYPPPSVRDKLSPEMEKELEAAFGNESMDKLLDDASHDSTTELAAETKIVGQVVSVHGEDVFMEIPGSRHQGLLPVKQFETPPEPGAQLDAIVSRFNSEQGYYELTLSTAAVDVGNWDEVAEGQVVEVSVTGSNKGGLECKLAGIRGFIPMGQISVFRVENPEEYVGQRLACVVTEANRQRGNLVLSHRALMERERKEKREQILAELEPGQVRDGTVRSLQDFGAFVDLGGVDGLIHISQISWDRIGHPKEVLEVGQAVKVRVVKVNQETGKIGLAYRDLGENPWTTASEKYAVGSRVKGTVTKLMQFGAFVKLEPGVEGLIHISELGHGRVHRAGDVVSEAQEVEVHVLSVDVEAQKIGLSLKALMPKPAAPAGKGGGHANAGNQGPGGKDDKPQRRPRKHDPNLKGGLGGPSGGEQFGLRW